MQCPNCLKNEKDDQALFCSHCGYEFARNQTELERKLSTTKQSTYTKWLYAALLVAVASLLLVLFGPYPFLYVITAVLSWSVVGVISNRIGLVDRNQLPNTVVPFLKKMGYVVLGINLCNIATIVFFIISLF